MTNSEWTQSGLKNSQKLPIAVRLVILTKRVEENLLLKTSEIKICKALSDLPGDFFLNSTPGLGFTSDATNSQRNQPSFKNFSKIAQWSESSDTHGNYGEKPPLENSKNKNLQTSLRFAGWFFLNSTPGLSFAGDVRNSERNQPSFK